MRPLDPHRPEPVTLIVPTAAAASELGSDLRHLAEALDGAEPAGLGSPRVRLALSRYARAAAACGLTAQQAGETAAALMRSFAHEEAWAAERADRVVRRLTALIGPIYFAEALSAWR